MEQTINWFRERIHEVVAIWKELLPVLFQGIINTILLWWGLYVAAGFAIILSIARSYWLERNVDWDSFFYPNFLWGVKWTTIIIVVYQVLATLAKRLKSLRIEAGKYNWSEIDIYEKFIPSKKNIKSYWIEFQNRKPYAFRFYAEMPYLELDGVPDKYIDTSNMMRGRKLTWEYNGFQRTDSIPLNEVMPIGKAEIFHKLEDGAGEVVFYMPLQDNKMKFETKSGYFRETARGEIEFTGFYISTDNNPTGSEDRINEKLLYCFEVDLSENKMSVKRGKLDYYPSNWKENGKETQQPNK